MSSNIVEVPLYNGGVTVINSEDLELVSKFKWYRAKSGNMLYARAGVLLPGYPKTLGMHRLIMGMPIGMIVDHRNNNGLDNTRDNLRVCTIQQNICNQKSVVKKWYTPYKGVYRNHRRFFASIMSKGKVFKSITFDTDVEAAIAYNKMAIELHGEFANLNEIY